MAKHDWPFDFPKHAKTGPKSDLNAQDLYELIIRAVAVGTQESTRTQRTAGSGQTADQVAAAIARGSSADVLHG